MPHCDTMNSPGIECLDKATLSAFQQAWPTLFSYGGKHLKARFSVSTGVKIENFMRIEMKNYIERIIVIDHCI